jgi:hypothetical protein
MVSSFQLAPPALATFADIRITTDTSAEERASRATAPPMIVGGGLAPPPAWGPVEYLLGEPLGGPLTTPTPPFEIMDTDLETEDVHALLQSAIVGDSHSISSIHGLLQYASTRVHRQQLVALTRPHIGQNIFDVLAFTLSRSLEASDVTVINNLLTLVAYFCVDEEHYGALLAHPLLLPHVFGHFLFTDSRTVRRSAVSILSAVVAADPAGAWVCGPDVDGGPDHSLAAAVVGFWQRAPLPAWVADVICLSPSKVCVCL